MQNGQVPTSKVQFQLPVLWKEECAGAGAYGPLRTDYELHFSAPHLWHHFGSWKSASGSRYSTKSSKCYKSGPDINSASWLKDTSTVAVTHSSLSMMCVCVCVWVCVSVCVWLLVTLHHFWNRLQASLVAQLVKNPPANAGDTRDVSLIPGLGGISGEGKIFLSGKSHRQRSLAQYSTKGCKESDTTEPARPTLTEPSDYSLKHQTISCPW